MRKLFTFLFAALMSAASMWAQTETLLTTITATGVEQANYSTEGVATVSFSYTAGGSSAYVAIWGWWGYGWSATVNAAEGYTITKCVFYDDANRTATDSEAPFVVETTEEDKTPKVNGTPILKDTSKGIKKIDVYGYENPEPEPEPAGEVTVVFAANNKTVERTVTLPHTFKCDWNNGMEIPDELDIIIHELYNDYYYCNSNMNASGSDQVEVGTEEAPKNDYITIKGVFEGTATVTGDYFDWITGEEGAHNYSITISIKGDEPQSQETVVTITEADYVSGNTITKDGVTLTVNQIYGVGSWYLVGPGTFTNTIGNFTKIEVTTVGGTVFIEGDGWTGDLDKMTWTGNAPSVSFVDDIMGKGQGFSIVCTIAAGEPEPAGKSIVVFEANGKKKEVEIELPHTFWCDLGSENGELDLIIQELYALPQGGYCDYFYDGPVATGNPAVTAGADDDANHFITISEAFEGTATVSGKYNKYTDMDEEDFTYTLTISIKAGSATAVENVQTNHVQGTKILRDGMLLIEKNGKIYNVMGAEVK